MTRQRYSRDQLIDYEHKMCLYGQPSHIMPYQLVTMPDGCEMSFVNETYVQCDDSDRVMPLKQLEAILKGALGAMDSCDHHLLKISRLQLTCETSWEDPSGQVRFLYLPFESETCEDDHQLVARFIQQLQRASDMNCERSMSLLHGLNIALAERPFNLSAFRGQLKGMLGGSL